MEEDLLVSFAPLGLQDEVVLDPGVAPPATILPSRWDFGTVKNKNLSRRDSRKVIGGVAPGTHAVNLSSPIGVKETLSSPVNPFILTELNVRY